MKSRERDFTLATCVQQAHKKIEVNNSITFSYHVFFYLERKFFSPSTTAIRIFTLACRNFLFYFQLWIFNFPSPIESIWILRVPCINFNWISASQLGWDCGNFFTFFAFEWGFFYWKSYPLKWNFWTFRVNFFLLFKLNFDILNY